MPDTKVSIVPVTEPDELFCHYPGQSTPQDAYLELDLTDGVMRCGYNPEVGHTARPEGVFRGRILWFTIPPLTADAANQLMTEVLALAQRIIDGAEIIWNGNNHVGHLSPDAQAAHDELDALCGSDNFEHASIVCEWDASDWYEGESHEDTVTRLGLTAETTNEQLATIARQEERDADSNCPDFGYSLLSGAEKYLSDLRGELR